MCVVYVLFASSCRGITRESYDKSPENVYSRFDFAEARGAPVRVYRESRIKKITAFDFFLIAYIFIRAKRVSNTPYVPYKKKSCVCVYLLNCT